MVYIIILNWNRWQDTIECLESVFRLQGAPFRVLLCDNGSSDDSVESIKSWAEGRLDAYVSNQDVLRTLTFPQVLKPILYEELVPPYCDSTNARLDSWFIILRSKENVGFAAGKNIGLKFALGQAEMQYVWLLNNDTVVEPGALRSLIERAQTRPSIGMCGSTIRFYSHPHRVQVWGGAATNCWFATSRHLGDGSAAQAYVDADAIEEQADYMMGRRY